MLLLPLATLRPQGVLRFARCRMSSTTPEQQLESVSELQRSVSSALATAREQAEKASSLINLPQHEAVIRDLESKSSAPDFWDDAAGAEATLRELSEHKAQVEHATSWRNTLDDAEAALQLLPELNNDAESAAEMLGAELRALETLASELAAWEVPDPPQQPQLD